VDAATEKRAHREHDGRGTKFDAGHRDHAADALAFHDEVATLLLEQGEVGLVFELVADESLVELAIRLDARGAHCRALAGVERARLDRCGIGGARHHAAQSVDLLDQVAFANAADGRIAAHLAQGLDGLGQQQRARAHARGREGSLGTGVPATHDDYVKQCCGDHGNCVRSRS
jgi:hypothetical protein